MIRSRFILFGLCILSTLLTQGQNTPVDLKAIEPNITKQVKFLPYLTVRHGGPEGLEAWKKITRFNITKSFGTIVSLST